MENTKIGNKEAIALLTTISFNQIIIFGVKSIIKYYYINFHNFNMLFIK